MIDKYSLLRKFPGERISCGRNSYKVCCPCHADGNPSLCITFKPDKILMFDFGGCNTKNILDATGLTLEDLGTSRKENNLHTWRDRLEYGQRRKYGNTARVTAVYNYSKADGTYLYSKVRIEYIENGKREKITPFVTLKPETDSYEWGNKSGLKVLYNLPSVVKAVNSHREICICEGEKDCRTLEKIGYAATTPGGAKDWKEDFAKYFVGAEVLVFPDNDEAGRELRDKILQDLRQYAHSITVVPTSEDEKGDVTDFFDIECGGVESVFKDRLRDLINECRTVLFDHDINPRRGEAGTKFAPWVNAVQQVDKETKLPAGIKLNGINEGILSDCIISKMPYFIIRNESDDKDFVYLYRDGVYQLSNTATRKAAVRNYLPSFLTTETKLRNTANLIVATNERRKTFSEVDAEENIINFRNGIYSLPDRKLSDHSPQYLSTIQIDAKYNPDTGAPVFMAFMRDLCRDVSGNVDADKMKVLQEFGGYAISNHYGLKKCLILYSPHGDTGKSQLIGLLSRLIGMDKVANISIQDMNERGSNRFMMGGIVGKRLIANADQKRADVTDSSIFKSLTGGKSDSIKTERKGKDAFTYLFKGALVMGCNALPTFTDDKGGHLFDRLLIIPCEHIVPESGRDVGILDKILLERSGIINWFLEGLHRLRDNGFVFSDCTAVEKANELYRAERDTVFRYICKYYVITKNPADRVKRSGFNEGYYRFCYNEGMDKSVQVQKKNLSARMQAEGCSERKIQGEFYYLGIREKSTDEIPEEPVNESVFSD